MHVAIVTHIFFPDHRAGVETYALQLAASLAGEARVTVVTTRKVISLATGTIRKRSVDGIDVVEVINDLDDPDPATAWRNDTMERALGEVLSDLRPDVVHFQHLMYWSAAAPSIAREQGARVFLTLHDYWLGCARFGQLIDHLGETCPGPSPQRCAPCMAATPLVQSEAARRWIGRLVKVRRATGVPLDGVLRGLQRLRSRAQTDDASHEPAVLSPAESGAWAARYEDRRAAVLAGVGAAHRLITPSATLRDTVVEWGVPEESIVRVPQGLEHEPFASVVRRPASDGVLRLGFIGTIAPHKGVHVLVEAAAALDAERVTLDVWGPDRQHADYGEDCRKLAAGAPHVRFHGPLERDHVAAAHSRIDVLCVPSLWNECCPLTIQEAFMSGMPCVVSSLGGMAELVEDGVGGLRAAPGDVADWRRVLGRLLDEAGLVDELRARIPTVPTLDEHVAGLLDLYRGDS